MVPGKEMLHDRNFKYVILALGLGSGKMLVGLEKYCQCKLKGLSLEATTDGSDDN